MRLSIFAKVFLGFWLVSIAVLASWLLTNTYFESLRFSGVEHRQHDGPPTRRLLGLVWALENADAQRITPLLTGASAERGVNVWLLDTRGRDWRSQSVPADVAAVAARLGDGRRRALDRRPGKFYVAHRVIRPGEGQWSLVLALPPPPHRVIGALGASPWLRALLAILVSGLACWGLSRLLTHRFDDLRKASRELANGNLDARIAVRDKGGDETDELARDFNTMADQLAARIAAQKQLLSDVSHELRSPLARLRVAIALAEDEHGQAPDYLARMEKEAQRLEDLISQLLSSEPQALRFDDHIDLVALLRELCQDASFEGESAQKQVALQTQLSEAVIATSDDLLHKSFDNLIRNALQHTPRGTTVSVSLSATGNEYCIEIDDCGSGVSEADLQRIFDPLYRVDSARSRAKGGYGLGLAITRRAIEGHHGSVAATNTGHGLRMTVRLPQAHESDARDRSR